MAEAPEKRGSELDLYFCDNAHKTLDKILAKARAAPNLQRMVAKIEGLFDAFIETGKIANREHFNSEDEGFWAFKAYQLRAYGWYSNRLPRAFVISHFVIKKKNNLDQNDKVRMRENRARFESGT